LLDGKLLTSICLKGFVIWIWSHISRRIKEKSEYRFFTSFAFKWLHIPFLHWCLHVRRINFLEQCLELPRGSLRKQSKGDFLPPNHCYTCKFSIIYNFSFIVFGFLHFSSIWFVVILFYICTFSCLKQIQILSWNISVPMNVIAFLSSIKISERDCSQSKNIAGLGMYDILYLKFIKHFIFLSLLAFFKNQMSKTICLLS
jgi:hypothetical protein